MKYTLLGKTCGGKTLVGKELNACPLEKSCPAIISSGSDIIVIGNSLETKESFQSVVIPAELFSSVAKSLAAE